MSLWHYLAAAALIGAVIALIALLFAKDDDE